MSRGDIYMVVDADGLELPRFICTSMKEVADFLKVSTNTATKALACHNAVYRKYRIEKIVLEEDRIKAPFWVIHEEKGIFEPKLVGLQEYEMLCMKAKADLKRFPNMESCKKYCDRRNREA